jgi:hypothetical protein
MPRAKPLNREASILDPHEPQHGMARLITETTYLPIAPFAQHNFEPSLVFFMLKNFDFGGPRGTTVDVDATPPSFEAGLIHKATDFCVIDLLRTRPGMLQLLLELSVVRHEQHAT